MEYLNLNITKDKSLTHIKQIIKHISKEYKSNNKDSNIINEFEDISLYNKKLSEINEDLSSSLNSESTNISQTILINEQEEYLKLLARKNKPKSKYLNKTNYLIEDILFKSNILKQAGISLSSIEWYKIKHSLNNLISKDIKNIKFWGKILGKYNDYYVIQAEYSLDNNSHINKYTDIGFKDIKEPRFLEGANKFVFYVTNDIYLGWIELPDITYEQLRLSRLFKYIFSGNLNSYVKSFVPFPGKESHLLKCIILRIMHSSYIAPEGYMEMKSIENSIDIYGIDLNDKLYQVKDEYQNHIFKLSNEELSQIEKWVHAYPFIYNNGKIINLEEENQIPILQSISNDKTLSDDIPLWNIKEIGDKTIYTNSQTDSNSIYSLLLIQNTNWPGSYTVYKEGHFYNIYIGNGVRLGSNMYYPLHPNEICKDPEDNEEFSEPNPNKEPDIIESDSDIEDELEDKEEKEDNL